MNEIEVVFSLNNIFIGKTKKGESFPQRIISVAEEVFIRDVYKEQSCFKEYPVWEDSPNEGVDAHLLGKDQNLISELQPKVRSEVSLRLLCRIF